MKVIVLAATILFNFNLAYSVDFSIDEKIQKITEQIILTRLPAETCKLTSEQMIPLGGRLELEVSNFLADLSKQKKSTDIVNALRAKNCIRDCSCFALEQILVSKKISESDRAYKFLQKNLSKMTDKDYFQCYKKITGFCEKESIQEFLKN